MLLYSVNLVGGGADLVCADCLPLARADRDADGIVSVALVDAAGEDCGYCGEGS